MAEPSRLLRRFLPEGAFQASPPRTPPRPFLLGGRSLHVQALRLDGLSDSEDPGWERVCCWPMAKLDREG